MILSVYYFNAMNNLQQLYRIKLHFEFEERSKISWLVLFMELIDIYSVNLTNPVNTFCGQNTVIDC
jgi:hypothetical protein